MGSSVCPGTEGFAIHRLTWQLLLVCWELVGPQQLPGRSLHPQAVPSECFSNCTDILSRLSSICFLLLYGNWWLSRKMYNSAGSCVKCFFHSRAGAGVWLILCYTWVCKIFFLQVSYLESRFNTIHLITMGKGDWLGYGEELREYHFCNPYLTWIY